MAGRANQFDEDVLNMLACPVCFGGLRLDNAAGLIVCAGCARRYPLVDGIPVLIRERAREITTALFD